jgi:AcrB/AcrD/AcrF family
LLSALIGSISLIPFIVSSGTGAEIEKPLAIVVVGGLVTRPIKIVILPMVYEWVEHRAALRAARKAGVVDLVDEDNNTEQGPPEQEVLMEDPDGIFSPTEQGRQQQDLPEKTIKEDESDESDGSHS